MTILVIGATGTLGRQIVKEALDKGYNVKCLTRNFRRGAFLKYWGATLVYGDLAIPETIPRTFKGVRIVIDASTVRPDDTYSTEIIDWLGKLALLESAKLAKVTSFIFFDFLRMKKDSTVPVLQLKSLFREKLSTGNFNSTTYCLEGFFQGLIEQYALPLLERQAIWQVTTTNGIDYTAYIDSQDAAKIVIAELTTHYEEPELTLFGNVGWSSQGVIELCERLSGITAKVYILPELMILALRQTLRLIEATWNIADRLSFYEILNQGTILDSLSSKDQVIAGSRLAELHRTDVDAETLESLSSLEEYLQDYFAIMRFESFYTPVSEQPQPSKD
jgi:hypothetical protein